MKGFIEVNEYNAGVVSIRKTAVSAVISDTGDDGLCKIIYENGHVYTEMAYADIMALFEDEEE